MIDLVILLVFVAYSVTVGLRARRVAWRGLAGEAVGLAAMAVTSTVAAVAVIWWTPPTDPRQLQSF